MKTKMKDDPEDIPMAYLWYVVLAILADCGHCGCCGHSILLESLKVCDLTIRSITDCVDMGHVTLDVIFPSGPRSISYPRMKLQRDHVVRIELTLFQSCRSL